MQNLKQRYLNKDRAWQFSKIPFFIDVKNVFHIPLPLFFNTISPYFLHPPCSIQYHRTIDLPVHRHYPPHICMCCMNVSGCLAWCAHMANLLTQHVTAAERTWRELFSSVSVRALGLSHCLLMDSVTSARLPRWNILSCRHCSAAFSCSLTCDIRLQIVDEKSLCFDVREVKISKHWLRWPGVCHCDQANHVKIQNYKSAKLLLYSSYLYLVLFSLIFLATSCRNSVTNFYPVEVHLKLPFVLYVSRNVQLPWYVKLYAWHIMFFANIC